MTAISVFSVHGDWVFVTWNHPGKQRKTALKELRQMENKFKEKNVRGWIAETGRDNYPMRRVLEKMGARAYHVDLQSIFYQKEL